MKILLIANPRAGRGKTLPLIDKFESILKKRGHEVDKRITTRNGDARNWASLMDSSVERLVVAGGDGTVNEVINGLKDPASTPLLHLATGTANMLAKDLGLPSDLNRLADLIDAGRIVYGRLGLIEERKFLLILTAGFDAWVTEYLAQNRPESLGYLGYIRPILKALRFYKPVDMRITVDDNIRRVAQSVMTLKVRHYGGYFVFSPEAGPDSDSFHILLLENGSIMEILKYATLAFLNRTSRMKGLRRVRGRTIVIDSDEPVAVQVDGDYWGKTPVKIRLSPERLALMKPAL
jgi:YegS/Rv2252/BmrU family lipid kinase